MSLTDRLKSICITLLGILLIALSFGEYLKIAGINLSWIIAILLLLLTFLHMLISRKVELISNTKKYNIVLFFFLFWMLYMFVQGVWAKDIELWQSGVFSNLVNIIIIFEMWYLLKNERENKRFLKYSVPLWILNILMGFYEAITKDFFIQEGVSYWDQDLVRTFFVNPNDCATWFILAFLLLAYYLIKYSNGKVALAIAWCMTAFVVYNTGSRACLIGIIAYAAIYLFGSLLIRIGSKNTSIIRFLFWSISIIGIVLLFWGLYSNGLTRLINELSGEGNIESDILRVAIIKDTIQTIVNSAFMGVGANQTITYISINPHNFLLEMFSDFGLLVFGITCYFCIKIIGGYFNKNNTMRVRLYSLSCIVTFILISISSSSMNRLRLTWILLIILYLSIESYQRKIRKEQV